MALMPLPCWGGVLPGVEAGGDIARCPRGAFTHLTRHLLTGRPDGGPLSRSLGMTGRPAVIILASSTLPPMYISVLTTCGSRFGGVGVKGDSQS